MAESARKRSPGVDGFEVLAAAIALRSTSKKLHRSRKGEESRQTRFMTHHLPGMIPGVNFVGSFCCRRAIEKASVSVAECTSVADVAFVLF